MCDKRVSRENIELPSGTVEGFYHGANGKDFGQAAYQ
jgi:hypothetical protein